METELRMEVAVYAHESVEYASVVCYRLLNSDLFYVSGG